VADFIRNSSRQTTRVRSPQAAQLRDLLVGPDVTVASSEATVIEVHGLDSEAVGEIAARHGMTLHELTPVHASLEEAFMELTRDSVEYHGVTGAELVGAGRSAA
jgi:ABC-2 type transport system ATP-binding protein